MLTDILSCIALKDHSNVKLALNVSSCLICYVFCISASGVDNYILWLCYKLPTMNVSSYLELNLTLLHDTVFH